MSDYNGNLDENTFYIEHLFLLTRKDLIRMLMSIGVSYGEIKLMGTLGELMACLDTKNVK